MVQDPHIFDFCLLGRSLSRAWALYDPVVVFLSFPLSFPFLCRSVLYYVFFPLATSQSPVHHCVQLVSLYNLTNPLFNRDPST